MVFSSPIFLFFFFPAAYLIYRLLPSMVWRNGWLAFASLVFFSFGQLVYVPLLLGSVGANYIFGVWLQTGKHRKAAVVFAVVVNIGLLAVFKYMDFFLGTLNGLLGLSLPLPGLTLPIGISFFTFQGLSYVLDVYRDPTGGTRNLGKVLLYISFFPQLIAGPIVLYRDVAQQIDSRTLTPELTLSGLSRFIGGLGKKLLLADTLGRVADSVFALTPNGLDARLAWLGAICYTLQIYFDFSGYSDMAIGLGRVFGFRFAENFNLPYQARSIREFWRRWHISLSSWFRDYLYIPLGGNRKGRGRTLRNRVVVFLATGLWHGANWTFVLWGVWHGLFSVLEDTRVIPRRLTQSFLGHLYTLFVVTLGFVLFRADSLPAAGVMLGKMFTGVSSTPLHTLTLISLLDARTVFFLVWAVLLSLGLPQWLWRKVHMPQGARGTLAAVSCGAVFCVCVLEMVSSTFSPFLYFQF